MVKVIKHTKQIWKLVYQQLWHLYYDSEYCAKQITKRKINNNKKLLTTREAITIFLST